MKNPVLATLLILVLASCQSSTSNTDNAVKDTIVIKQTDTVVIKQEPVESESPNTEEDEPSNHPSIREGKHSLTIQWISWEQPGIANIKKLDDGWYRISGEQSNPKNKDYVYIVGKIKPVTDKELHFEGLIEYYIESLSPKPCIKKGVQTFLSTKGRKYWRLQNMQHCEGVSTDYVDIYF